MPSSSSRPASHGSSTPNATIDKLEYKPGGRPLLRAEHNDERSPSARPSTTSPSYAGSFFEAVAEGVMDKDRSRMNREATRYFSFAWAIVNCLCAGSITAYSLYAPLFQKRLGYSQLQVNGVSITAELAMYLPVPVFGVLCDRYGPGPPSLLAGALFGIGYILAAFAYNSGPPPSAGGEGWPYSIMVLAFIPIGMGTSCMYLSAVTTCAKNFGRGKYKGVALALPIAAFGLSGMWESQIGSRILYEKLPDGSKGPVDVYRFFIFLGCLFFAVGLVGCFVLRIVGEEELIDEAVDELERSGLLEESEFFRRRAVGEQYGTMSSDRSLSDEELDELSRKAVEHQAQIEEEQRKKSWLLNAETRYFLADHTMWWLAAGFFLVTGPGEAFINNLGTIIDTFYHPSDLPEGGNPTSATTHVSIVAITSTIARILTGTLTDLLAPTSPRHQHRRGPHSLENSMASLPSIQINPEPSRFQISRITFLLAFALLCSLGQILLATGIVQDHAERFWLVSACIGAGYGATFSLTPIVVSVVWGVENFGTNWGIVATVPAIGATVWGLAYSGVYQWAAGSGPPGEGAGDVMCYGKLCYMPTFWAMAASVWVACGLWFWAWRGKGGWVARGILV
jgi:MFS family permease